MAKYMRLVLDAVLFTSNCEAEDASATLMGLPAPCLIVGLLADALGWEPAEQIKRARLRERLRYAIRVDRYGGWIAEHGSHYDTDKRFIVALCLQPEVEAPSLPDIAAALREPARPLFFGNDAYVPSEYIFAGFVKASNLLAALGTISRPADAAAGSTSYVLFSADANDSIKNSLTLHDDGRMISKETSQIVILPPQGHAAKSTG